MKYAKDQKTGDMGFAGMNNTRVDRDLTKYEHNQWSGHANDGREVNMGRGPTRGNDGSCGHSGFSMTGRKPPVGAGGSGQKRGGGTAMPKTGRESFNMGRGPTKGNQQ
jgi:hypothetical protein